MTPVEALSVLYAMARRAPGTGEEHDAVRAAGPVLQRAIVPPEPEPDGQVEPEPDPTS